ncbi:MAG: hypothetical protein ACR2F6_14385 [Mycobacteriales bacterium]
MTVLVILLAGFGVGVIALALLAVELLGHLRRLRRAVDGARGALLPELAALQARLLGTAVRPARPTGPTA